MSQLFNGAVQVITINYYKKLIALLLLICTAVLLYFALTLPIISFVVDGESIIGLIRKAAPSLDKLTDEGIYLLSERFLGMDFTTFAIQDDFSVISGATELWRQGSYLPSALIFVFSIIFPIFKLVITAVLAIYGRLQGLNKILSAIHRVSMLDVFVVSVIVFVISRSTGYEVSFGDGFYVFVAYFFTHLATSAIVTGFTSNTEIAER